MGGLGVNGCGTRAQPVGCVAFGDAWKGIRGAACARRRGFGADRAWKSGEGRGPGMRMPREVKAAEAALGTRVQPSPSELGPARGEAGVGMEVGRP